LRGRLGECKAAYPVVVAMEQQREEPNNGREQEGTSGDEQKGNICARSFNLYLDNCSDVSAGCCGDLLNSLILNQ
jgi:hypothetical protein